MPIDNPFAVRSDGETTVHYPYTDDTILTYSYGGPVDEVRISDSDGNSEQVPIREVA